MLELIEFIFKPSQGSSSPNMCYQGCQVCVCGNHKQNKIEHVRVEISRAHRNCCPDHQKLIVPFTSRHINKLLFPEVLIFQQPSSFWNRSCSERSTYQSFSKHRAQSQKHSCRKAGCGMIYHADKFKATSLFSIVQLIIFPSMKQAISTGVNVHLPQVGTGSWGASEKSCLTENR